jgi:ammonia channel protein AmtB
LSGFIILAVLLGSVVWILGAAWGWHPSGWLTTEWGFHDAAAAGCVHTIAGFFALGVLINLGPRVGRFSADGKPNDLRPHNLPMSLIGLMLIIVGFFGFLGGCIIYVNGGQWVSIYGTPATLSAFAFNTLMGCTGGIIGCYFVTRDPFWMMSGALVGIISAASGLDLYYPPLAFLIGFIGGCIVPFVNNLLIKFKIDDAVGAVAVHGVGGLWGVVAAGIFAAGYPNIEGPAISLGGQIASGVVMVLLGFIPGYVASFILKQFKLLRTTHGAEVAGLDTAEIPVIAYPEGASPPAVARVLPAAAE